MILDLHGLLNGSVQTVPFAYQDEATGMSTDIKSGTVEAEGEIRNFSGYILLTAQIVLKVQVFCARCGCFFDTVYSFQTEQKMTDKLVNNDDDDFILIEDKKFDVSDFVNSSMLLEMPTRFLCSEDCKGLCPKCGHNLNESRCSCDDREIDPRLAVLSEYFNKK